MAPSLYIQQKVSRTVC